MANGKSVLITGANGFIGARLCATFLNQGFRVIAGVRQNCDRALLADLPVEYRYGDVLQPDTLPDLVRDMDYVVHNAGVVKAPSRERFFAVNGQGTLNLVAATAQHNPSVTKFVYVSSLAVAGPSRNGTPVTESVQANPITTYGRSKLAGEQAVLAYKDKLPITIVRPVAVYGPGDKGVLGFFRVLRYRLKPYFGDVSRRVQLVHVDDLSRGILAATVTSTESGAIYFIAENRAYSLRELMDLVERAEDRRAIVVPIPASLFRGIAAASEWAFRLVGATPRLTREKSAELLAVWEVSTEKAKRDLGFESSIPFERGARETYEWYCARGWL